MNSLHPFISSQMRWSAFVWLLHPGFGWPTGGSSLSWRAPPGPQTVAGAVCCAVGRCCWLRGSWSIWCPEVCLWQLHTVLLSPTENKGQVSTKEHFVWPFSILSLCLIPVFFFPIFIFILQLFIHTVSLISFLLLFICPFVLFFVNTFMPYLSCFISVSFHCRQCLSVSWLRVCSFSLQLCLTLSFYSIFSLCVSMLISMVFKRCLLSDCFKAKD